MDDYPTFTSEQTTQTARTASRTPILLGVLAILLILLILPYWLERLQYSKKRGEVAAIREGLQGLDLASFSKVFSLLAQQVGPSVVHIDTQRPAMRRGDPFMFGLSPRTFQAQGQASGVVVDSDGYIVTNWHVVAGATAINVKLNDDREFVAEVIGIDEGIDLAVIKINADGLIACPWGDSDKLEVGEPVWAIGNPFGLDRSITFGILSAKGRRGVGTSIYQEFLQTDAAVNPGNSGGPLVNLQGQIVGINTAIVGQTYQGISFAIPSNIARGVYEQLKANGRVPRGYLGVGLGLPTPEDAQRLGIKPGTAALVTEVAANSPAERAGIEPGDVIVSWNGQEIVDATSLTLMVARTEIGSTAKVVLLRDGKEQTVDVTVGERPNGPR